MVWVRAAYANELAVLSAWLAVLLPWNVTWATFGSLGSMLFVRFAFLQVQFTFGLPTGEEFVLTQSGLRVTERIFVADPVSARTFYGSLGDTAMATANTAWTVGAVVLAIAFLLSLAMYREWSPITDGPFDPVRVMGGLLAAGAVLFAAATWLFWNAFTGIPLPVGLVLMAVLAGILLTVDRQDAGAVETGAPSR